MRTIILTLISLRFVVYSEKISCEPFPSGLKTVKECCALSKRQPSNADIKCSKFNQDDDKEKAALEAEECFLAMYANVTGTSGIIRLMLIDIKSKSLNLKYFTLIFKKLIVDDRNLNKNKLMLSAFSPFAYNNENHHEDIVKIATENCEFVSTGNLSLNLATFYDCINNFVTDKCTHFTNFVTGCDLVEEHLIKCGRIATNCDEWPEGGLVDSCCKSPKVIKDEIQDICARDCKKNEYFQQLLRKCFFDCIVRETKVMSNNKLDMEIVKKVLIDNTNNTAEWEKPIEAAVTKCEKNWKGFESLMVFIRKNDNFFFQFRI
jgi:hypothetical protein